MRKVAFVLCGLVGLMIMFTMSATGMEPNRTAVPPTDYPILADDDTGSPIGMRMPLGRTPVEEDPGNYGLAALRQGNTLFSVLGSIHRGFQPEEGYKVPDDLASKYGLPLAGSVSAADTANRIRLIEQEIADCRILVGPRPEWSCRTAFRWTTFFAGAFQFAFGATAVYFRRRRPTDHVIAPHEPTS
jgi:hypothetical protein